MSSYSASLLKKNLANEITLGMGSFSNIDIDGRLSLDNAKDVARDYIKKEAGDGYIGFVIEKTERFVDYKNPIVVDNNVDISEITL